MTNLISKTLTRIHSLLKTIQVKQLLSVVLVGFIFLTTHVDSGRGNSTTFNRVNDKAHQIDSERPKTTREWQREARQTEDSPGERLKNIGSESAEAVKEWGGLYPDTAKRSTRELKENTKR
ncbi:MAG TPA: hypothetical protein V6C78_04505 [Crinalium sp.]